MEFFWFSKKFNLILIFSLLFSVKESISQGISIQLGNPNIGLNEVFTISIVAQNKKISTYDNFPEIPGMLKRGTSSSSSTSIINGQVTFSQTTTQNYMAPRQGKYKLKPFTIVINGEEVKSKGLEITVGPPQQVRRNPFDFDPFEDFYGNNNDPVEYIDRKADAFFGITTNKDEVYVGEGVTATLAFYVSAENRAELEIADLIHQHSEILKKIRPNNCWEENFSLEQIEKNPVVVNNKSFMQYKIYQAVFYPLNVQDIVFPSVDLKMTKYVRPKGMSFFGGDVQEKTETFTTKRKVVKVKDLPPHPMKDRVGVGNYKLEEFLSSSNLNTGEAFNYDFKIVGEGNIAGLAGPQVPESRNLEFYSPNIKQSITRSGNKVTGSKVFSYHAIPNEPGTYPLKDYFRWIFFNPSKKSYDTLSSKQVVNVIGESKLNSVIGSSDHGDFYDKIELIDNSVVKKDRTKWSEYLLNIFIGLMIVLTLAILIKK